MKIIFHCHSNKSKCSNMPVADILRFAKKNGINKVFLTDHNYLATSELDRATIVPGVEISTCEGDLIGVFLPSNFQAVKNETMAETIKSIKDAGGLVIAPHPGDLFRREAMKISSLIENIQGIDIIEVYNGRNLISREKKLRQIADKYDKNIIYGSDAHFYSELANVILEMPDFKTPKEFMASLKDLRAVNKRNSSILPHLKTFIQKRFG